MKYNIIVGCINIDLKDLMTFFYKHSGYQLDDDGEPIPGGEPKNKRSSRFSTVNETFLKIMEKAKKTPGWMGVVSVYVCDQEEKHYWCSPYNPYRPFEMIDCPAIKSEDAYKEIEEIDEDESFDSDLNHVVCAYLQDWESIRIDVTVDQEKEFFDHLCFVMELDVHENDEEEEFEILDLDRSYIDHIIEVTINKLGEKDVAA